VRLLFVLPVLPYPPADGGTMKIFNVLKYLSSRHQCDLICFCDEDSKFIAQLKIALPAINDIRSVAPPTPLRKRLNALINIVSLRPPSFGRFASTKLRAEIIDAQRRKGYDAIHFDIINMAQYYDDLSGKTRLVHSPNDATSLLYFRLARAITSRQLKIKFYLSAWLLRRFERRHYEYFAKVHVVSEDDKNYLVKVSPLADVEVIPVCSGYSYSQCETPAALTKKNDSLTIVVCGNLGDPWIASGFALFLEQVLPQIGKQFSNLKIRAVGRDISPALGVLVSSCQQVEHTPWVDDFEQFLRLADIVLVPDMAGAPGAKTRVVQAMALGLPVVGSRTAFEGIPSENGVHGFVYASQAECCEILSRLLEDGTERKRVAVSAARLAAEEYSFEQIGPRYEELYFSTMPARNLAQH
jgi:glycosyltransferase involved in cell wall biosynthesis